MPVHNWPAGEPWPASGMEPKYRLRECSEYPKAKGVPWGVCRRPVPNLETLPDCDNGQGLPLHVPAKIDDPGPSYGLFSCSQRYSPKRLRVSLDFRKFQLTSAGASLVEHPRYSAPRTIASCAA